MSDGTDLYIASTCFPTGLKSLNPATMDLSEVYRFYDHIISAQSTPNGKNHFKFTREDDNLSSTPPTSTITPSTTGTVAAVGVSASPLSAAQDDRDGGAVDTESSKEEVGKKRRRGGGRGNGRKQM